MANTRDGNVDKIDTTNTDLNDIKTVVGIKYVGNTGGTATVKALESGTVLWNHNGATDAFDNVQIRSSKGIEVEVTNGAVVYIYSKL